MGKNEIATPCITEYTLALEIINNRRNRRVTEEGYTWGTLKGIAWEKMSVNPYIARTTEKNRKVKRHSHFYIGCYGLLWVHSFQCWSSLAQELMDSKPHKRLFFQKGLKVLSLIQSTL